MSQKFPKPREAAVTKSANHKHHRFYIDPQMNSSVPAWFIEPCSRGEAERLLTMQQTEGNVLMRPSSQHNSYALTIRSVTTGVEKFNHYSVLCNHHGEFYMDIDNKHSPVPTLSQVIELFIQLAGSSTHRAYCTKPKLARFVSNSAQQGILARAATIDENIDLTAPVSPVNGLPAVAARRGSADNPYIDTRVTAAQREATRRGSRNGHIHPTQAQAVHHTGDGYLTLTDEHEMQSRVQCVQSADYLSVTDNDADPQLVWRGGSDYIMVTGDDYLQSEQQHQQLAASRLSYLTLTDAPEVPLDTEVKLHGSSPGSATDATVYDSPKQTPHSYINLYGRTVPTHDVTSERSSTHKQKPAAPASNYLKPYNGDPDLPDNEAPPPPVAVRSPPPTAVRIGASLPPQSRAHIPGPSSPPADITARVGAPPLEESVAAPATSPSRTVGTRRPPAPHEFDLHRPVPARPVRQLSRSANTRH